MAQLSKENLSLCIQITDTMLKSPGCSIFKDPVNPERDQIPDYFQYIKNPQDVGTIRKRLDQNYYSSVSQWMKDMNLVWENAKTYNGPSSIITIIANCMKEKFDKECRYALLTQKDWTTKIAELFAKMNIQMKAAPGILKPEFEGKRFSGQMSQSELQRLADAASSLTENSDTLMMMQLLNVCGAAQAVDSRKTEHGGDSNFVILKNLPNEALQALNTFVKERFRALHKHYPE